MGMEEEGVYREGGGIWWVCILVPRGCFVSDCQRWCQVYNGGVLKEVGVLCTYFIYYVFFLLFFLSHLLFLFSFVLFLLRAPNYYCWPVFLHFVIVLTLASFVRSHTFYF